MMEAVGDPLMVLLWGLCDDGGRHTLDFLGGLVVGVQDWALPGDVEVGLDGHVGGREGERSN